MMDDSAPNRITSLMIDGNSLGIASVEMQNGTPRLIASEHVETPELLEVVRHLRHPIFMDLRLYSFPGQEVIEKWFADRLNQEIYNAPVAILLSADKIWLAEEIGSPDEEAIHLRRDRLLETNLPNIPYDYPCLAIFHEIYLESGMSITRLTVIRLSDLAPLIDILENLNRPFIGIVPATDAGTQLLHQLEPMPTERPVVLCDVGKLRTSYAVRFPNGQIVQNTIPVGLARDGKHYFKSINPSIERMKEMEQQVGKLLLPLNATPHPIAGTWAESPQIDSTRFASQISRYAIRTLDTFGNQSVKAHWKKGICFVSGRATRMAGLCEYMQQKMERQLFSISQTGLPGLDVSPQIDPELISDNLLAIGGAMNVLTPFRKGAVAITKDVKPMPREINGACSVTEIKNGLPYVLEQKP